MSFDNPQMISGPMSGPPPQHIVCEPVPVTTEAMKAGPLPCRRGKRQHTFQGQKPPECDGHIHPVGPGEHKRLECDKCGLVHATVNKDGVLHYGPVL